MTKLLVETPQGIQELIEVGPGGGYFDLARVTWDERIHGPFPPALRPEVGGLVRSGASLVVDAAKKASYLSAKQAAADLVTARQAARVARRARLATANPGAANSVVELRAIVQDLLDDQKDHGDLP